MSHQCKSILFTCMDFRLGKKVHDWMEEQGLMGDCDIVSLAGSAKEIVDGDQKARELLFKQIDISIKLHKACQVILLNHSRCGAYNAVYDFKDLEEEKAKHKTDLTKAEILIKKKFPGIKVIKLIADMIDDKGEKLEFINIA